VGLHLAPALRQPFLHVSGMFPAERGCLALVWPLATHPTNKNELIVWDCAYDPRELFALDADTIRTRIFTRSDAMPEGMTRLPVKSVHLNKSPMLVANLKTLSPAMATKWGLDLEQGKANAALAAAGPNMDAIWAEVFYRPAGAPLDVDEDLYNGFVSKDDRRLLDSLRKETPARLAAAAPTFSDPRLVELLFRYRARNFPDSLSEEEMEHWEQHRAARFYDGAGGARSIDQFFGEIDHLQQDADQRAEQILTELYEYVELIAPAQ